MKSNWHDAEYKRWATGCLLAAVASSLLTCGAPNVRCSDPVGVGRGNVALGNRVALYHSHHVPDLLCFRGLDLAR
jgi:hypothetical protein